MFYITNDSCSQCGKVYKHNVHIYTLYFVLQKSYRENIIQDRKIYHVDRNYTMHTCFITLVMYCKKYFSISFEVYFLLKGHLISLEISKCYIQKIKF